MFVCKCLDLIMLKNNKIRVLYILFLYKIGIYSYVYYIKFKFKLIIVVYVLRSIVYGFYVLGINLKRNNVR